MICPQAAGCYSQSLADCSCIRSAHHTHAAIISENTAIVNNFFVSINLPTPSFDFAGPPRIAIPPKETDVVAAHLKVIDATKDLRNLMLGPTAALMAITVRTQLSPSEYC